MNQHPSTPIPTHRHTAQPWASPVVVEVVVGGLGAVEAVLAGHRNDLHAFLQAEGRFLLLLFLAHTQLRANGKVMRGGGEGEGDGEIKEKVKKEEQGGVKGR